MKAKISSINRPNFPVPLILMQKCWNVVVELIKCYTQCYEQHSTHSGYPMFKTGGKSRMHPVSGIHDVLKY